MTEIDDFKNLIILSTIAISDLQIETEIDSENLTEITRDNKILIRKTESPLYIDLSSRKIVHYDLDIECTDMETLENALNEGIKKFNMRNTFTLSETLEEGNGRYMWCDTYWEATDISDLDEKKIAITQKYTGDTFGIVRFQLTDIFKTFYDHDDSNRTVVLRIFPYADYASGGMDLYMVDTNDVEILSIRDFTPTSAKVDVDTAMVKDTAYDIVVDTLLAEVYARSGYDNGAIAFLFQNMLGEETSDQRAFYNVDSEGVNASSLYPQVIMTFLYKPSSLINCKIIRNTMRYNKSIKVYEGKITLQCEVSTT